MNMDDIFGFLFYVAIEDGMPLAGQMIKISEEVGELAEQVNHQLGFINHKEFKEPLIGEVADVICAAMGVLAKAYRTSDKHALMAALRENLIFKGQKWEKLEIERRNSDDQSLPSR
jgi:hypothetical protein